MKPREEAFSGDPGRKLGPQCVECFYIRINGENIHNHLARKDENVVEGYKYVDMYKFIQTMIPWSLNNFSKTETTKLTYNYQ